MNTTALQGILSILVLVEVFTGVPCRALQAPGEVTSHWDKTIRVLKTSATLQVVTNPLLRRGSSIHNRVYQAIHDLGCDYVRYLPWLPYPKLGVAELEPPQLYWNLSAALFAYVYARLAQQGIDVVAESQIVGFPTQFPSVSMLDWNSGQPNVRYWVLKLIHDNFAPGDKLVETASTLPDVFAQGFVTLDGRRKLLLVNKRDRSFALFIPGSSRAEISYVDETTGLQPPALGRITDDRTTLRGLAVAVVTFPD